EPQRAPPGGAARPRTTSAPGTGGRFTLRDRASAGGRPSPCDGLRRAPPHVPAGRPAALLAKLLIEDLADKAGDRDGIEAHVRRGDDTRVDDLALRQRLEHALEMAAGIPLLAPDPELLALEREARGVAEAEHARDQALVHQLGLVEHLAVRRSGAGADDEPGRHFHAAADLHLTHGPIVLR